MIKPTSEQSCNTHACIIIDNQSNGSYWYSRGGSTGKDGYSFYYQGLYWKRRRLCECSITVSIEENECNDRKDDCYSIRSQGYLYERYCVDDGTCLKKSSSGTQVSGTSSSTYCCVKQIPV